MNPKYREMAMDILAVNWDSESRIKAIAEALQSAADEARKEALEWAHNGEGKNDFWLKAWAQGKQEGLEEAAKVCDCYCSSEIVSAGEGQGSGCVCTVCEISREIRSLIVTTDRSGSQEKKA